MITSTRAIVIHQVKYSETSIITTLYTEAHGRQSYIVNGIRNTKSKQKAGLLQPLFLLEIEAYQKSGREIQRLKEFRPAYIFKSIPFDVTKRSIALFLSEILFKILKNEEADADLFQFVYQSLIVFDTMEKGIANFHLWFISKLLSYLGLQPQNNYDENCRWFDMKNGKFVITRPLYPETPDTENSKLLSTIFSLDIENIHKLELNGTQRLRILEYLIDYYTIHIERIGKLKSVDVLSELFH